VLQERDGEAEDGHSVGLRAAQAENAFLQVDVAPSRAVRLGEVRARSEDERNAGGAVGLELGEGGLGLAGCLVAFARLIRGRELVGHDRGDVARELAAALRDFQRCAQDRQLLVNGVARGTLVEALVDEGVDLARGAWARRSRPGWCSRSCNFASGWTSCSSSARRRSVSSGDGRWKRRFGQRFEICVREFVLQRRQERKFGVNPWTTHHRFIVSYHTLKRPEHREPLFQYLERDGKRLPKSLLVLDEAHTVAPSAPSQYAVDSELTDLARKLAPPFENRLFLSAPTHNGHSNSFSTLLELLDPQRFTRGVPVQAGSKALEEVMVRRLKRDLQDAALGHAGAEAPEPPCP
jgi:hypothetical protein